MTNPRTPDAEPSRPRINVELLDRIEQQITEHPETWDQGTWFLVPGEAVVETRTVMEPPCGTACCVAGWAAVLSGYQLELPPGDREGGYCVSPEGDRRHIESAAAELLGLDGMQSGDLFHEGNDLATVQEIIAELREIARGGASE